jgi:isopropylmalate/homocitrate/citramalate synthase
VIPRDRIWTGKLNALAAGEPPPTQPSRAGLYDTTLRDGEQTVGVVLSPEDKLEIAVELDRLGIDRIEAGFPRVSAEDQEAYRLILDADLDAEVWGFSRAVPADVEALLELGVGAAVIESPVSDAKLSAYGISREKLLSRVRDAIGFAAEAGVKVAYFGVDGSRADLGFAEVVYRSAIEAGASELVMVDTLGVATPETAALMVASAREWVGPDVPVHWHGHDDFGLGTATAIAAVRAGAGWVQGTVNGMGERAGNVNLGQVALALDALYGVATNLRFERLRSTCELVRERSGYELEPWKPLLGENLFVRESGAVASQFHDPPSIEPYSSELLGAERRIVLGKKSGLDSIRVKCDVLGLDLDQDLWPAALARVKALGVRRRGLVSDEEFRELARALSSGAPGGEAAGVDADGAG